MRRELQIPFREEDLATLNRPHTNLLSHVDRTRTPGIAMICGSLGQSASTAAGVAVAMKMNGMDNRVFVVFGDGDIAAKFTEFGWFSQSLDGHDVVAINDAIDKARANKEKPLMIED